MQEESRKKEADGRGGGQQHVSTQRNAGASQRHPCTEQKWAIVLFSVRAVDGVHPTDGLTASIWGILTKGNMMLHEAMRQEAKRFSPSVLFLWEGRRRWSRKPREQLMALP